MIQNLKQNQKQNPSVTDWQAIASHIAAKYGKAGLPASPLQIDSEKLQQQIAFVTNRLLQADSDRTREAYRQKLNQLKTRLAEVVRQLDAEQRPLVPTRDVHDDLLALQEEFSQVNYDLTLCELTVVTDPVELEGVYLGPFKIVLETNTLSSATRGSYFISAVDPYPSSSHDHNIHPHVNHGSLCEGDALLSIQAALLQGRLFDFFQIVNQVLHTYNAGSAYVSLSDWGDIRCQDCGHLTDSDEISACYDCEESVCDSCYSECCDCQERFCSACCGVCTGCLSSICKSCVQSNEQKPGDYCADCLEKLNQSREEDDDEEDREETTPEDSQTPTAVHADGLGQAVVPA